MKEKKEVQEGETETDCIEKRWKREGKETTGMIMDCDGKEDVAEKMLGK